MHVLFEDDGQLKAGTVLADHDQSLQVEAVSGKRVKIKATSVLLRFASPGPAEALGDAQKLTADLDFGSIFTGTALWLVSDDSAMVTGQVIPVDGGMVMLG